MSHSLGVRWTVGDVAARGWEALRLSVHCAIHLFGTAAEYAVCVNSAPAAAALDLLANLPAQVRIVQVGPADIPAFLRPHLGPEMAEGVGWKLLPTRLFPDSYELSLDNDCILWEMPAAMRQWFSSGHQTLLAGDTERCLGIFQQSKVPGAINSGIRGLPPGFDLAGALAETLRESSAHRGETVQLTSELDEQGLQAVALNRASPALVVSTQEVSICSPFWPRDPNLGTCGAHFVGLNSRHIPWNYFDRPGNLVRREHWDSHREELYRRAGLPLTPPLPIEEPS